MIWIFGVYSHSHWGGHHFHKLCFFTERNLTTINSAGERCGKSNKINSRNYKQWRMKPQDKPEHIIIKCSWIGAAGNECWNGSSLLEEVGAASGRKFCGRGRKTGGGPSRDSGEFQLQQPPVLLNSSLRTLVARFPKIHRRLLYPSFFFLTPPSESWPS